MNTKPLLLSLCICAMGGQLIAGDANAKLKKDNVVSARETELASRKAAQKEIESLQNSIKIHQERYDEAKRKVWANRLYFVIYGGVAALVTRVGYVANSNLDNNSALIVLAAVLLVDAKCLEKCHYLLQSQNPHPFPQRSRLSYSGQALADLEWVDIRKKEIERIEIKHGLSAPKIKLHAGNL